MQKDALRHSIAYFITTSVYAFVIFLVLYTPSHTLFSSQKPEESVMKMSLSQFVPPAPTPPEPIVEEIIEEPVVPEPVEEPEPVVEKEPEPVQEVEPEPIVEKETITPVKKVAKKEDTPKKKLEKKKQEVKKKEKKKKKITTQRHVSRKQNASSRAQVDRFWTTLRKKIDRKKSYPRIAKKRRMEGTVEVKFTILRNGNVGMITVSGPKIFHASAKKAVRNAFPINVKHAPISLPTSINLPIRYQLR
jgi:protein TonB